MRRASRCAGARAATPLELEVTLEPAKGKRAKLNGGRCAPPSSCAREVATLVFTPDRLAS